MVLSATNGQEALEVLDSVVLSPDYIFLDINMPVMDGRKCLEEIRRNPRFRDINVVMYSTTSNQDEINNCKLLGARFLVKPDKFSKLVKSLAFILGYSNDKTEFFFVVF